MLARFATPIGVAAALALAACAPQKAPEIGCALAIENVTLVPMDKDGAIAGQTVRIADGKIQSIGAVKEKGTVCERTIDGNGRFLAPGLNDMHMHVESEMFASVFGMAATPLPFEDLVYVYLSNGVTGVRVMSGAPDILAFRDSQHGPAPRMLVASPMLSGDPPMMPEPATRVLTTAPQAVEAINGYADAGYDFIKVRENLSSDVLKAVMETAAQRGLLVDGHPPRGADPFANGRRGIAHVNELSLLVKDREKDPAAIAARAKACDCFVTSTLVIETNVPGILRNYDALAARPEMRFVYPLMRRALWDKERNPYLAEAQDPAFFDGLKEVDKLVVKELGAQDVPLLAGTDAMIPMILPGASLHDELTLLVEAGLTPYQAIRAATVTPSEIFQQFGDLGTVAPGRAANLVLLSGNPLENVGALRKPEATIVGGIYLDRATLDAHMEEIAQRFAAS